MCWQREGEKGWGQRAEEEEEREEERGSLGERKRKRKREGERRLFVGGELCEPVSTPKG